MSDERMQTFDMQEFLGLSDRDWALMKTKWALIGDINLMLEDVDADAADLAEATGEDAVAVDRWLRGMVRDVSLDVLSVLYDAAAARAGWPSLELVIRTNSEDVK